MMKLLFVVCAVALLRGAAAVNDKCENDKTKGACDCDCHVNSKGASCPHGWGTITGHTTTDSSCMEDRPEGGFHEGEVCCKANYKGGSIADFHKCCNFAPVGGYKITPGPCRGGSDKWDDTKELWKCIDVKTVADCGKACDADAKCGAYDLETEDHFATGKGAMAQGKEKKCCLFMDGNKGQGGKGIKDKRTCFVKTYELKKGFCRGGPKWPSDPYTGEKPIWKGGELWMCIGESHTVAKCQEACDQCEDCGAYDIEPSTHGTDKATGGECCLFMKGHTGNGEAGRSCFVKRPIANELAKTAKHAKFKKMCGPAPAPAPKNQAGAGGKNWKVVGGGRGPDPEELRCSVWKDVGDGSCGDPWEWRGGDKKTLSQCFAECEKYANCKGVSYNVDDGCIMMGELQRNDLGGSDPWKHYERPGAGKEVEPSTPDTKKCHADSCMEPKEGANPDDSPWLEGPSWEDASANTLHKCAAKCKAAKKPAMQFNPPDKKGGETWCGCLSFVDGHAHGEFDKAMNHKTTDRSASCVICELELPKGAATKAADLAANKEGGESSSLASGLQTPFAAAIAVVALASML